MHNSWIQTYTGKKFHFLQCTINEVDINDIAHALSNICRFNGHTSKFYSVCEHSIYVSRLVPPHLTLDGLLHDAAEAYIGDMPSPQKKHYPLFKRSENQIMSIIAAKFKLRLGFHKTPAIKYVDSKLCYTEGCQLMSDASGWPENQKFIKPYDMTIRCFNPRIAKKEFLKRFWSIYNDDTQTISIQNKTSQIERSN